MGVAEEVRYLSANLVRDLHWAIELLLASGGAGVDRHRARARLPALQRLRRDLEAAAEAAVGDAAAAAAALTREAVDRWPAFGCQLWFPFLEDPALARAPVGS